MGVNAVSEQKLLSTERIEAIGRTLREARIEPGRDLQVGVILMMAVASQELCAAIDRAAERIVGAMEKTAAKRR